MVESEELRFWESFGHQHGRRAFAATGRPRNRRQRRSRGSPQLWRREGKEFPSKDNDLVTVFDCLHDMGDPVGAATHVRNSLSKNGTWMTRYKVDLSTKKPTDPDEDEQVLRHLHRQGSVKPHFQAVPRRELSDKKLEFHHFLLFCTFARVPAGAFFFNLI